MKVTRGTSCVEQEVKVVGEQTPGQALGPCLCQQAGKAATEILSAAALMARLRSGSARIVMVGASRSLGKTG